MVSKPQSQDIKTTADAQSLFKPSSPLEPLSENSVEDDLGYDEPSCSWNPGESDDDCGEGVVCPPCG
ncbi:MAG: hypothetical protein ACFB4I_24440 [Cyanophyceae cyanobacterium]